MSAVRALVAGVACIAIRPGPGLGLELPTPARLLGTGDPFEVLPDSLPATATFRSSVELRELYRFRRGPESQDYDLWHVETAALVRTGKFWTGARHVRNGLRFDRREVYEEQDDLRARRQVDHVGVLVVSRTSFGELWTLLGGSSRPEFGLRLRKVGERLGSIDARWWWTRGATDVSQKVHETTFFFPFDYHEQVFRLELDRRLPAGVSGRLQTSVRFVTGEETYPDQYNRLDLDQNRLELALRGPRTWPLELVSSLDLVRLGLEMTVNSIPYARARDLKITHGSGEIGWRFPRRLRLAAGYEHWKIRSTDPSFVDVWPFAVWDVFTATRYRLESLDLSLGTPYVRAGWTPHLEPFSFGLQLTFEWWNSRGDLFWKKRVPTLPPFFFKFDHFRDSLALRPTNAVQLDARIRWSGASGRFVQLDTQLAAPFGRRDREDGRESAPPTPSPSEREPKSVRGGLRAVISVGADW